MYIKLLVGRKITLVGLSVIDRSQVIHEAEITGNKYSEVECSTKPVRRVLTRDLMRNWEWIA